MLHDLDHADDFHLLIDMPNRHQVWVLAFDRPLERVWCGGGDGEDARIKGPRGPTRHQIVVRHRRRGVAHRALAVVVHLCGMGRPHPCHQAETGSGVVVVVWAPWKLYNTPSPSAFGRG
jgi:hypothetical protein